MSRDEKRAAMVERIRRHGEILKRLYGLPAAVDPVKLCKRLRRVEVVASRAAVAYCNGEIEEPEFDSACEAVACRVESILGVLPDGFFCNGDPRGYSLKIRTDKAPEGLHRDWGGYGILAPDLTEGF